MTPDVTDIKIICKRYKWNPTDAPDYPMNEVSFFCSQQIEHIPPILYPVVEQTVDLYPNLKEDGVGDIDLSFDDAKEVSENNYQLYFAPSNTTISISNNETLRDVHGNDTGILPKDFFMLYTDLTYRKFLVTITGTYRGVANTRLYEGFLHKEGLKLSYSIDSESNTIELNILGLERELREYYLNQSLAPITAINNYDIVHSPSTTIPHWLYVEKNYASYESRVYRIDKYGEGGVWMNETDIKNWIVFQTGANGQFAMIMKNDSPFLWEPGVDYYFHIHVTQAAGIINPRAFHYMCGGYPILDAIKAIYNGFYLDGDMYDIEDDIKNWFLSIRPYFRFSPATYNGANNYYISETAGDTLEAYSGMYAIKTGIENFISSGENKWDYLKSLCNGMGWVFFFNPATMKFTIKNRTSVHYPISELNYDDSIISVDLTHSDGIHFDSVLIHNGGFEAVGSNDENHAFDINGSQSAPVRHAARMACTGERFVVFSRVNTDVSTNQNFFDSMIERYSHNGVITKFYFHLPELQKFNVYGFDNDEVLQLRNTWMYTSNNYQYWTGFDRRFVKQMTLIVPCSNPTQKAKVDVLNADNNTTGAVWYGNQFWKSGETLHGDNDSSELVYSGNACSSLFKKEMLVDNNGLWRFITYQGQLIPCYKIYHYEDYVEGKDWNQNSNTQAADNFEYYLASKNTLQLTLKVTGVIVNPLQRVRINNYPYNNTVQDKLFSIIKLSYNILNNTTTLTLQEIREMEVE